jgi:hypothetical protein
VRAPADVAFSALHGLVEIETLERSGAADFSELDRIVLAAWKRAELAPFAAAHELDHQPWDSPRLSPPRNDPLPPKPEVDSTTPRGGAGEPLHRERIEEERVLRGTVALGLVLVSGPRQLELSFEDKVHIVQQAMRGANFLVDSAARGALAFAYDIRDVVAPVLPGPYAGAADPYERLEREWRDHALRHILGAADAPDLHRRYMDQLRVDQGADWAYAAYVTRFPLEHFAYANGDKVVMHAETDGWNPSALHRLFAHETCHVFGAADEYGACDCRRYGRHAVENHNCVRCTHPSWVQQPCLMKANTPQLCSWTRGQIGW